MKEIPIRAIGGYFPIDNDGFIINPTRFQNIPASWVPLIMEVKSIYLERLASACHSIYLRGSVAQGNPIEGISDLDTFALVKEVGLRWEAGPWSGEVMRQLQLKYPFVAEIEFMLSSFDTDFAVRNPQLAMVIQTQSLCLFGENLQLKLPKYKPSGAMLIHYRWLEQDTKSILQKEDFDLKDCQAYMKLLLRVGFELVMEREKKFTTQLYWCYQSFSKYYPHWADIMKKALHYYLNPIRDRNILEQTFKALTDGMLIEIQSIEL